MDRNAIYKEVQKILMDTFELEADIITLEANLFEDLALDSIDAVDLVVKLQEYSGKKIDPKVFKTVRTISDVVDAVADILEDRTVVK